MKIAYVLKRFPRFSETFILNEILELEKQGAEIEIFSLLPPLDDIRHEHFKELKAPVFYLPEKSIPDQCQLLWGNAQEPLCEQFLFKLIQEPNSVFNGLFSGKKVKQAIHLSLQATTLALLANTRGIQHFHAHFASDATTVSMLAGRLTGISYSFTAHAKDIYHTYTTVETDQALLRQKINESSFVVTVSEYNRNYLENLGGITDTRKIIRLYNGIDQSRFKPTDKVRNNNQFLAVGRFVEKKGFKYLVDACAILKDEGIDFQCLLVGYGDEEENLNRQITENGLENEVLMPGSQTQEKLMETMRDSSLMVLPCIVSSTGDRDGLPTVLLEAMMMELPLVSTKVAGIPEIIDHEETGLLVPPEDPEKLAAALKTILKDRIRALNMGKAGRVKAQQLFSLDNNVNTLLGYFNCAVSGTLPSLAGNPK